MVLCLMICKVPQWDPESNAPELGQITKAVKQECSSLSLSSAVSRAPVWEGALSFSEPHRNYFQSTDDEKYLMFPSPPPLKSLLNRSPVVP